MNAARSKIGDSSVGFYRGKRIVCDRDNREGCCAKECALACVRLTYDPDLQLAPQ